MSYVPLEGNTWLRQDPQSSAGASKTLVLLRWDPPVGPLELKAFLPNTKRWQSSALLSRWIKNKGSIFWDAIFIKDPGRVKKLS